MMREQSYPRCHCTELGQCVCMFTRTCLRDVTADVPPEFVCVHTVRRVNRLQIGVRLWLMFVVEGGEEGGEGERKEALR
uniref:Uncharacterized protein n=1 Tax=Arion vulgaris TaxID=1028688 RepID=A0A0B6Y4N4_9EUPU